MGTEFDRLLARARRAEQVRWDAHRRETDRQRGVCWSGLEPGPCRSRPDDLLAAEVARRLHALEAWRASGAGRLLRTLGEVQRAAQAVHAAAESARAAIARASAAAPSVEDLAAWTAALAAAARQAERLMDESLPSALSGRACATNTASNSPSTASSTSSAS